MTINSSGLYTATEAVGGYTVCATAGAVVGTAAAEVVAGGGGGGGGTPPPGSFDAAITMTPATTYQEMDGVGVSARAITDPHTIGLLGGPENSLVISDAQFNVVLEKLFSATNGIGLNRMRMGVQSNGFESANDNADPLVANEAAFNYSIWFAYDWLSHLSKIKVFAPALQFSISTGVHESWMYESMTNAVAEYAEWQMQRIRYFVANGHTPTHHEPVNEPSYSLSPMSATFLRDLIKNLRAQLDAEGLSAIKFAAPSDITATSADAVTTTIMADSVAKAAVHALSFHMYGGTVADSALMKTQADTHGKKLWMNEWFIPSIADGGEGWANVMHELIVTHGCSAVDYLFGYFGQGEGRTSLISLNHTGTAYNGYTINPEYYTIGHWSKFVRAGDTRILASHTAPSTVKVSAFTTAAGKKRVVVHNPTATGYNVQMAGGGTWRVHQTAYYGTDKMADKGLHDGWAPCVANSLTTIVEQ